jgi:hypothetical protein
MNVDELSDAIRAARKTELSRLGSSKALYAATDGRLEGEAVLRAAAAAERAAAETFEAWAESEDDPATSEAFRETAREEAGHAERVREELGAENGADDHHPGDGDGAGDGGGDPPAANGLQAYLRGLDGTAERAGGLLGRVLVADESKSQYVGYFVGNADPTTAGVFRELRGDLDGQRERALDLLGAVCADGSDVEAAEAAALCAVDAAYEAHVAALESLGVDPKPVC